METSKKLQRVGTLNDNIWTNLDSFWRWALLQRLLDETNLFLVKLDYLCSV